MASRLGMAIRTQQANDRIDDAVALLTKGQDVPAAPEPTRDAVLRGTQRLEWIASVLEALATQPAPKPATKPKAAPKDGG
jgi:hypothetical protein